MTTLRVVSLFRSLQGESRFAGTPCGFVRLAGCPVGCRYCDTPQAQSATAGNSLSTKDIVAQLRAMEVPMAQVTGGEPLAQSESSALMADLVGHFPVVAVETSGAYSIAKIPDPVHVVMDVKLPGAQASLPFCEENISCVALRTGTVDIKFVVTDRSDFHAAVAFARRAGWDAWMGPRVQCFVAPESGLPPEIVARWLLDARLPWRLGWQWHKVLWPNATTEV